MNTTRVVHAWTAAAAAFMVVLGSWASAAAFCGFYVSGADASLYNNATMVVLMREDRRTVLSMQNNYQGPAEDFAMVIPVPQVLQEENVKTLSNEVFSRVDQMAAPRLVEYWEQDPCRPMHRYRGATAVDMSSAAMDDGAIVMEGGGQVRIEAEFEVGEYEIVVLSADDSTALETWLNQNDYNIPDGAAPLFRPYIESGMYFFVAKVNVEKVSFTDEGQAQLSPLRFHYDSDDFNLPIRLGLINAGEQQDLIVHILARNQRYDVANYPNATIPTNIKVNTQTRDDFASFYAKLFDATRAANENAVITEYSWNAGTCDPCPGATLTAEDFLSLGEDVLPGATPNPHGQWRSTDFVLTRLHARYDADDIGEDLVFTRAEAIQGGRGTPNTAGEMSQDVTATGMNNFQGRYAILHPWEGAVDCKDPYHGSWGGPPNGHASRTRSADDLAFANRGGVELASYLVSDVDALNLNAPAVAGAERPAAGATNDPEEERANEATSETPPNARSESRRGCAVAGTGGTGVAFLLMAVLAGTLRRRRS